MTSRHPDQRPSQFPSPGPSRCLALLSALLTASLWIAPASADLGDCSQPLSTGTAPTASDCLFILNAAVDTIDCVPQCACAPSGTAPATATDALFCLNAVVGAPVELDCPCSDPTWFPIDPSSGVDLGHEAAAIPEDEQIDAGSLSFTDVTVDAGLGAAVGGGNEHGVGVAFADLSGDGWEDIVVINGRDENDTVFPSHYYINNGDGTFTDASVSSLFVAAIQNIDGYSIAAADYDSDGDLDLYVGAHPEDLLIENLQGGTFFDATAAAEAGGPATVQSGTGSKVVSFGDLNGDGHMDLVSASSDIPGPGLYLLLNDGDGTFTDITDDSGAAIDDSGNPCAVLWTDYDTDGDADLFIWNDRGGRVLLSNDGDNTFTGVTTDSGIDAQANIRNPMGIDGADVDHDGDLDYYVSNIGNNPLLRNNADGTFTNITSSAGTGGDFGWGLGFEDFNLDTHPDIFVAQEDNLPFIAFTNGGSLPTSFSRSNVSHVSVDSTSRAHNVAVAFADYDHDGRVDVLTATTDGSRISLFRNTTNVGTNRWLEVDVPSTPTLEAAGAVSARVFIKTGPLLQFREIYGGSSRASQNAVPARFGLGQYTGADWVAVQWPDGREIVVRGVEGNQRVTLNAP